MLAVVDAVLTILALPTLLASAYLLVLTCCSARPAAPRYGSPRLRFDVVVPAHDEEAGIAATVRSLLDTDYPADLRRVLVVADNCGDATAERSREAGAEVLLRVDPDHRGKGHALAHAFAQVLAEGRADAVVVVDADTTVSPNLLRAFAARLEGGAPAVQSDNAGRNPRDSWRACLTTLAFALFNTVRSLARERLGCSVGLRGTGMCISTATLRQLPYRSFSLVEDLEYGVRLGQAGKRVHFAAEARVISDMPASEPVSRSQRLRWEGGRSQLARQLGPSLLWQGLRARDRVQVDLGLDLLVPPLAFLAAAAALGTAGAGLVWWLTGRPLVSLVLFAASLAALLAYVARGWWLSSLGLRGLVALAYAPVYLVWKIGLALGRSRRRASDRWVRTTRERRT